jgi:hypothetical protein
MTQKKYTSRGSPPYPANECRGLFKTGNDGLVYESRGASNGVYRWIKASYKRSAPKPKPASKPRSKPPSKPRSRSQPKQTKAKYRLMTKAEISKEMPTLRHIQKDEIVRKTKNHEQKHLNLMKSIYGKHLMYLNPKTIRLLDLKNGTKFYGLDGQLTEVDSTVAERRKNVHLITFGGFSDSSGYLDGDKKIKYNSTYTKGDMIVVDGFGSYSCENEETGNVYGTGSGCDIVYIFAKPI